MDIEYEYGIGIRSDGLMYVHRENKTKEAAGLWIAELNEMSNKPHSFVVIRRPRGSWEVVD